VTRGRGVAPATVPSAPTRSNVVDGPGSPAGAQSSMASRIETHRGRASRLGKAVCAQPGDPRRPVLCEQRGPPSSTFNIPVEAEHVEVRRVFLTAQIPWP
jgi:hypothetical protein